MSYIADIVENAKDAINNARDVKQLEIIRVKYLGKKGFFTLKMTTLHTLPAEKRPIIGAMFNKAKLQVQEALNVQKTLLEQEIIRKSLSQEKIDVSLPGRFSENGCLHPITHTIDRIEKFFTSLGFSIEKGPEIEDYYHNFDALNIPRYHPARTDQDTFWFDKIRLLRTQTSGVQIRTLENQLPPVRIISPGRVYRNDYDQTHTPMFHQIEGLIVDYNVSFTNLKSVIYDFLNNFFETDLQMRFRPSYFPFTTLSAEVDVIDKNGKWLEIVGCGMVHPKVLKNVGIDPEIYSGCAFGMGVERLTMLRYGVNDIRTFFKNNLRFLKQFK